MVEYCPVLLSKAQNPKPLLFCRILKESESLYDYILFWRLFRHEYHFAKFFLQRLALCNGKEYVKKAISSYANEFDGLLMDCMFA